MELTAKDFATIPIRYRQAVRDGVKATQNAILKDTSVVKYKPESGIKNPLDIILWSIDWAAATPVTDVDYQDLYFKVFKEVKRERKKVNKTLIEHLLSIPKRYRGAAVRNLINQDRESVRSRRAAHNTTALIIGFNWEGSPEGFDFWDNVYEEVYNANLKKLYKRK